MIRRTLDFLAGSFGVPLAPVVIPIPIMVAIFVIPHPMTVPI
jgi:hypothetical protein